MARTAHASGAATATGATPTPTTPATGTSVRPVAIPGPVQRVVVSLSGGVSPEIRSEAPGLPPTLILQGDVDASTPVTDAYQLRDALSAAGRTFEIHIYHGEDHNWSGPAGTNALDRC